MKDIKNYSQYGFTLIELLVVIAIIGILSSIVLASLSGARESARDIRRQQDLRQIQTAMEMVYNDHGTYKIPNADYKDWFSNASDRYSNQLHQKGYTSSKITQPGDTKYLIEVEEDSYTVWAHLENPSSEATSTLNSCTISSYDSHPSNPNYCVSN